MRKLLYLFLVLPLIFSSCKKEEEDQITPTPQGSNSIGYFLTTSNLFLSTNEGLNWAQVGPNLNGGAKRACFLNQMTGFYVNNYGDVYKTSDGGAIWNEIGNFPSSYVNGNSNGVNVTINHVASTTDVEFVNEDVGYVVINNKLYKTSNGGENWNEIYSNLGSDANLPSTGQGIINPIDIEFVNESIGYFSYTGGLYKTTNGGSVWNLISEYAFGSYDYCCVVGFYWNGSWNSSGTGTWYSYSDIEFLNEMVGYACYHNDWKADGENWQLKKTTDGGQTWNSVSMLEGVEYVEWGTPGFNDSPDEQIDIEFENESIGYYLIDKGEVSNKLFKTTDGGQTWNEIGSIYSGSESNVPEIELY